MAYDQELAEVVREHLSGESDVTEKAMFGGLGFMIGGRMAVAVGHDGGLLVRCPPEDTQTLLREPTANVMVMRGREMTGWLDVRVDTKTDEEVIARWIQIGTRYVTSLEPK